MLPNNPIHPPIEVRLRDAQPYDGDDFLGYPDRQGRHARSGEKWLQEFRAPSANFVTMLERWLLFGPICNPYGSLVSPSDFIRIKNRVPYLVFDKARFPDVWFTDANGELQLSHVVRGGYESLMATLTAFRVNGFLANYYDESRLSIQGLQHTCSLHSFICSYPDVISDPRNPAVALATLTILEILVLITMGSKVSFLKTGIERTVAGSNSHWHGLLWAKMRDDGWRPYQLSRSFGDFTTPCLYFLCNL